MFDYPLIHTEVKHLKIWNLVAKNIYTKSEWQGINDYNETETKSI